MRHFLIVFSLFCSSLLSAQQLFIDFEIDSLTRWQQMHPNHWEIDSVNPISGNTSLHHSFDASTSGFDAIALQHKQLVFDSSETVWQFKLNYAYTPSASNNWAVWLAAKNGGVTKLHPKGDAEGYVLGVNYSGSDDVLKLWKQKGTKITTVFNSSYNWQDSVSRDIIADLRVTRSIGGIWNFFIDKSGGGNWIALGSIQESEITSTEQFGIYYEYTSTQDRKLWIDDIFIEGTFYTDVNSPDLLSYNILERHKLELYFSEAVDTTKPVSFTLNKDKQPALIYWVNASTVQLDFTNFFDSDNLLVVSGISDLKGNVSPDVRINFRYYQPQIYDLILTEILADPIEPVGLPEAEYIEIYNRSVTPINIEGWKLTIGDKRVLLPNKIIYPDTYYLVTRKVEHWREYTDSLIIAIGSLPALTNDGNRITISDKYNNFIYGVEYSSNWYESEFKREGGWSLEMVDISNPCIQDGNWKESISEIGGTPSTKNSVLGNVEDNKAPEIVNISTLNEILIRLEYSEPMDSMEVTQLTNYSLQAKSKIAAVSAKSPFFDVVYLSLDKPLEEGEIYTLDFMAGLLDCSGNSFEPVSLQTGISRTPAESEILINEVLFEAGDEVPEFIELYNNSKDILELRNSYFADIDIETGQQSKESMLTSEFLQFLPGNYVVFTQEKKLLHKSFSQIEENKVFELIKWPTLSNDGGKIALLNSRNENIDRSIYFPQMHFPLLNETKGVSLERLSFDKSGGLEDNWHSASSGEGYATPAKKNSQQLPYKANQKQITLKPKEISPDNDGVNDIIEISYLFSMPGYLATISIYNKMGSMVKRLVNNELCATIGSYTWDGLADNEARLPMGYYIVVFEAIHPKGDAIKNKQTVLMLPQKK